MSGDAWDILFDKAEVGAYDKIKMVPTGRGVVAYGVLYRWFTGVSRLGLAEQARMFVHPAQAGGGVGRARSHVAGQDAKAGSSWR